MARRAQARCSIGDKQCTHALDTDTGKLTSKPKAPFRGRPQGRATHLKTECCGGRARCLGNAPTCRQARSLPLIGVATYQFDPSQRQQFSNKTETITTVCDMSMASVRNNNRTMCAPTATQHMNRTLADAWASFSEAPWLCEVRGPSERAMPNQALRDSTKNIYVQLCKPQFGSTLRLGPRFLTTHHKFKRLWTATPLGGHKSRDPKCKHRAALAGDHPSTSPTHHKMHQTTTGLEGHAKSEALILT